MSDRPASATDAELAILDLLWDHGGRAAREITERLYPRETPADVATVQKLLKRLEDKKLVRRDRSERTHRFSASIPRTQFAAAKLAQMAEKLSGRSLTPLLVHLVESPRLIRQELDELRALVNGARGKRGGRG
jgi:predicted transcriptional regulator